MPLLFWSLFHSRTLQMLARTPPDVDESKVLRVACSFVSWKFSSLFNHFQLPGAGLISTDASHQSSMQYTSNSAGVACDCHLCGVWRTEVHPKHSLLENFQAAWIATGNEMK